MTEHSLWRFSRALHRAINDRHFEDIEALIDEDVDWALYGPIDMFPFLGARQGKAAVLDVIRQLADNFRVRRFDRESIMLGVDSAASLFADCAGFRQADLAAGGAVRPVQGGQARQHAGADRHLRSGRAGTWPRHSSAEDDQRRLRGTPTGPGFGTDG